MLDTCYMFPPSNVEQRSICEGLGSPLIDVRDQAGGQRKIFLFLPLSWVGRVGRASGGDADLGWAVFSGAVSRAGLRGSREERKLSGYDSRRPRRAEGRGGLGGTQPPALEAATRGPEIARASTPDITLPQHGIWGISGMGERRAWLVRPYKYANGGGNITECFALPRKQAAIFDPPVLSPSRQQVILLSSFLSPLPRPPGQQRRQPVLQRPTNQLLECLSACLCTSRITSRSTMTQAVERTREPPALLQPSCVNTPTRRRYIETSQSNHDHVLPLLLRSMISPSTWASTSASPSG